MSHQSHALAVDSPFTATGVAPFPKKKAKRSSSTVPTGLYRRKGSPIWRWRRVIDGTLYNESTKFTDLKDAIRWAEDRVLAIRSGNLGWASKGMPTVQEYFDGRKRTTQYDGYLTPFVEAHAKIKLNQITDDHCREWIATRLATTTRYGQPFAPGTVRVECAHLKAFFKRAVGAKKFLRDNPWADIKLPRKSIRKRKLYAGDEQSEFLGALEAIDPKLRRMAEIIIGSGLRREEICYLTPADVHHDAIHVPEETGKGRKARTVPVGKDILALIEVQRVLRKLDPKSPDRLFTIGLSQFDARFAEASKSAQLVKKITPHDLRRTYGSRMIFKVPPKVLQILMGHEDSATTMDHYNALEDHEVATIVAGLSSVLNG